MDNINNMNFDMSLRAKSRSRHDARFLIYSIV